MQNSIRNCPYRLMGRGLLGVLIVFAFDCAFSASANAYIDPNTGGSLFQILFPLFSVIAALVLFFRNQARRLWQKSIEFLRKWFKRHNM
jgi:hypothetical protein